MTPKQINPKDNTITIKRVKENWSRKEVIRLLIKLTMYGGSVKTHGVGWLDKWIEQNL